MSQTAGCKPMVIAGRIAIQRERCLGMTDLERRWRKQWLQDQVLAPNEPIYSEAYRKELMNPIRRFYRYPLDTFYTALMPTLGEQRAADYRYITGKLIMIAFGILGIHYYFKYQGNDWTKKGGWRVVKSKPLVLPGQPGFPFKSDRCEDGDYANRNFKNSPL